jgi:hypothetical protein
VLAITADAEFCACIFQLQVYIVTKFVRVFNDLCGQRLIMFRKVKGHYFFTPGVEGYHGVKPGLEAFYERLEILCHDYEIPPVSEFSLL